MSGGTVPVGTIIASIIGWDDWKKFEPEAEKVWCPADGRNLPKCELAKYWKSPTVPDLRGVFLRGLNEFEKGKTRTLENDPDGAGRSSGDYQADKVGSHTHKLSAALFHVVQGAAGGPSTYGGGPEGQLIANANSSPETRPRNSAVYYYVRIN